MIFCYPTLPLSGYSVQPGCGFLDEAYYRATINPRTGQGSVHPGVDLNGLGGRDTDRGDPVYAIGDGVVTHARWHNTWGNAVKIHHPEAGVWSQYGHLEGLQVKAGDQVTVGQHIGGIGKGGKDSKGNFLFWAHLHFEIRLFDLPADEWPSVSMGKKDAEAYIRKTRAEPMSWLAERGAARSLAELAEMRARLVQPEQAAPLSPEVPANWFEVRSPLTGHAIPGEWVSILKRGDELLVVQVHPEQLRGRGVTWE